MGRLFASCKLMWNLRLAVEKKWGGGEGDECFVRNL